MVTNRTREEFTRKVIGQLPEVYPWATRGGRSTVALHWIADPLSAATFINDTVSMAASCG
jgi:hypothetical protein